jgi:DNA-binding transcriptional MerR regulator
MHNDQGERDLIRNLRDAGCGRETIEPFLRCWRMGQTQEQLRLLDQHRSRLLERVHREERRIGCLDYLVYQINRPGTEAARRESQP